MAKQMEYSNSAETERDSLACVFRQSGLSKSMNDFRSTPSKQQQQQQSRYSKSRDSNLSQKVSVVVTIDPSSRDKSPSKQLRMAGISGMVFFTYGSLLVIIAILHSIIGFYKKPNRMASTIFGVYLYSVAAIFYIYIEIDQYLHKRRNKKNNNEKKTEFTRDTQSEDEPIESFRKPNYYEEESDFVDSKRSSKTLHIKEYPHAKGSHNHNNANMEKEEDIRGYIRINSRSRVQRKVQRDKMVDTRTNDEVFLKDIPKVEEEEDVYEDVFIDLSRLGGIFSHNGSSFFLRIGSLLFGLGHIIYIIFELLSHSKLQTECTTSSTYWWELMTRLFFVVLQMFVLFKNSHFTIKRKSAFLHKFGYVHIMATNLCMWITTLSSEIHLETSHYHKNDTAFYYQTTEKQDEPIASAFCELLKTAAPYLFPFILEYCLLCLSIVAVLYFSLKEEDKTKVERGICNLFKIDVFEKDKSTEDSAEMDHSKQVLFSKSHRGIFTGCLYLVATIISIIFFRLMLVYNPIQAEIIYLSVDLILNSILMGVAIAALVKLNALSFIGKPRSIDDVLIFLALCGGLAYHVSILYAALFVLRNDDYEAYEVEVLRICLAILCILQLIVQVVLVSSGLRRYPKKSSHLLNKPGRTCLTFLVIGNITAWIFHSTLAKTHELQHTPTKLFGPITWIVVSNITLPLLLFFYFHSSVCLADIWHIAYHALHGESPADTVVADETRSNHSQNDALDVSNRSRDLPPRGHYLRNNLSSIMRSVSVSSLNSNSRQAIRNDTCPYDSNFKRNLAWSKSIPTSEPLHKIEEYENVALYM